MTFARKLLYHAAGNVLRLLLFVLPVLFAISLVLGTPQAIKEAATKSHLYETFVSNTIDSSQQEVTDPNAKQFLADPAARDAVNKSLPPQVLEQSANSILDGVYGWLQGKTAEPEFTIDLTSVKGNLSTNLADYAKNKVAGLPVCTLQQLQTIRDQSDVLSLPCRPPGFSPEQLGQQFAQNTITKTDFLNEPVVTNQTIAKESKDGKTIGQTLSFAPKLYRATEVGKWVLLGLAAILTLLLLLARQDRPAGLRYLGRTFLVIGLLLGLGLLAYWFAIGRVTHATQGTVIETTWLNFAKILIGDVNKIIGLFAGVYVVFGAAALLWPRFRNNHPNNETATTNQPTPTEAPQTPITQ